MTTIVDGFGVGLLEFPFGRQRAFAHNGTIDGSRCSLGYFPDQQTAVAGCSNGLNHQLKDVMIGVLRTTFGQPSSLPTSEEVKLAPRQLRAYIGPYSRPDVSFGFELARQRERLTGQVDGQPAFPLAAANPTESRNAAGGITVVFSRCQSDGRYDQLLSRQGEREIRFARRPSADR